MDVQPGDGLLISPQVIHEALSQGVDPVEF